MKTIKVKPYNKIIAEAIKISDNGYGRDSVSGQLQQRLVDAMRLAKECRKAAKAAEDAGKDEDAAWLNQRAEDYEEVAEHWNQDYFDNGKTAKSKNDKVKEADERASDAADRAKQSADAAQRAADNAKEAAQQAQKAADDASQAGEKGNEAQEAANKAREQADKAQQAADEAKEAADKAEQHAQAAKDAKAKGDKAEAEAEANKAAEAASEAQKAADEAQKADNEANKAAGNNQDSEADTEDDESDDEIDSPDVSDGGLKNNAKNNKSKNKSTNSSSEDNSDESSEDENNSNNSDNQDNSDSSSGKSKSNSKSSKDDSSNGEGETDDEPVANPFADEEDIPQMPNFSQPQNAQKQPRDPTIDEIIKQLQSLSGDAKRGAVDGLKDLLAGKKNESLQEDFKKGLREFSDEEWDDLNDETLERIERVKKLNTVPNPKATKATFSKWANNPIHLKELEDEEEDNIRDDILKRRQAAKLDQYENLHTIKDFILDFNQCIKDQVNEVLQDYRDYSEMNAEYEGEDIIMKADVQKVIPSKDIPSIAVFFDRSTSWNSDDTDIGKQAIATVKAEYVDRGLCTLDLYYFADYVGTTTSGIGGGTRAWPYIVATIKKYDYKNVIIMTDSDMNDWNNNGEGCIVEGCVWWIWKNGDRAPNLPMQVRGRTHNFECEFHARKR